MNRFSRYLFFAFLTCTFHIQAQNIEADMILNIDRLSSPEMHGRGYVKDGRELAARYIISKFKKDRLLAVTKDSSYIQSFDFPVNTFPGKMELSINDVALKPGKDYLIDAASTSFKRDDLPVRKINLKKVHDSAAFFQSLASLDTGHAYYLKNIDDFCERFHIRKEKIALLLPVGCFIMPEKKKLIWTVSRDTSKATVFYVREAVLPKKLKRVSVNVQSLFIPEARNENLVACVPGDIKDTFITFTAHYDHLGMMGNLTLFPGASDNASGTAMLLALASYYSQHPSHYSILFIAFAGEEAGLMGSEYYTWEPLVPLRQIKFLTNIDIMGDATNGITVVNATKFPIEFDLLKQINIEKQYLPEIRSRGEAANSDHYYFTEAGVPSFFIYSNGGKGYYHDIFDTTKEIMLTNVANVEKLLIDFVNALH